MKTKIYKLLSDAKQLLFAIALTGFSVTVYSQATYTFNFTGAVQTLTLPAGNWEIVCWGANGGDVNAGPGGGGIGGYSRGNINIVTPGTQLNILVGGKGGNATGSSSSAGAGGWNGGGGGAAVGRSGAGGGGATDVRIGGLAAGNRVIVAGGGGGAAYYNLLAAGGNGGGAIAANGDLITSANITTPGGGGAGANGASPGTATQANSNGTATGGGGGGNCANNASTGQQGTGGGPGGTYGNPGSGATGSAGGGGGGYAGGAGGVQTSNSGVAGGGGSGYIGGVTSGTMIMFGQPSFTNNPVASGNGLVIIRELCTINLYVNGVSPGNALCAPNSATITTDAISNFTWSTGSNASSIIVTPGSTTVYSLTATSPSNCITTAATTIIVNGSVPVLSVTASSNSICLGNTVSIVASGALTYSWSGGITNGVPFTPSVSNTYTLQGQNGCGISTNTVAIAVAPLPVFGLASPTLICAGSTSTLSGAGATTYTWLPNNFVGANVVVSPQVSTTYTVLGTTGNCVGTNTLAISADPIPTLQVSASNSIICGGESTTLTASGALGYTWQPGNQTGSSIVVSPSAPTAYVVTGNNSFGCTSTAQQPVIAFASPTIVLNPFTTTICAGGTAIINASGANTYTWSTGPNTSSISVNPTSTTVYSVSGTNTLTQCSSSNTVEVSVFTPSMTVSSPTAICAGASATLSASGADTYQWSTGGFGPSLVVTPNSTTTYTVSGVTNSGNVSCSSTATTMVTINPLPVITAVASRSNICKNESTVLTATGGVSYLWSNSASTASISVSPTINTTYSVVGTDANGCKNNGTIFIRVYGCVGLDENGLYNSQILIYPNPGQGAFNVQSIEAIDLVLTNELGQVVMEIELNANNNFSLKVNDLSAGVYFLNSKNSEQYISKKIVIH